MERNTAMLFVHISTLRDNMRTLLMSTERSSHISCWQSQKSMHQTHHLLQNPSTSHSTYTPVLLSLPSSRRRRTTSIIIHLMKRSRSDNYRISSYARHVRYHPCVMFLIVVVPFLWPTRTGTTTMVTAFEFQHDTRDEDCKQRVHECTTSRSFWYKCPISCSQHFEREGYMAEEKKHPEQFFNMKATRQVVTNDDRGVVSTSTMSMEDNEGYITLYAILPIRPGMAQYYYDAIEHVAQVYRYTLVAMILPYPAVTPDDGIDGETLSAVAKSKSILLEQPSTLSDQPDILRYLLSREVVAGNQFDSTLALDRPTIFLISHNGMYIERLVAPTMETLERRVKVYESVMEEGPDL